MTLEHLIEYGGVVVCIWLMGLLTLAVASRRRVVLRLDRARGTGEAGRAGARATFTPAAPAPSR